MFTQHLMTPASEGCRCIECARVGSEDGRSARYITREHRGPYLIRRDAYSGRTILRPNGLPQYEELRYLMHVICCSGTCEAAWRLRGCRAAEAETLAGTVY